MAAAIRRRATGSPRNRALAGALLLAATWAGCATAASLQVAPTTVTLQGPRNADMLWLGNSGDAPVQVQLRIFRWTQADGEESLQPTTDLVASPAMRTLAPGERQMVRIVRTATGPVRAETAYRAIVDELPAADRSRQGLQFVLRYSIPVFVAPERSAGAPALAPILQARLHEGTDGGVLEVHNAGDQHAQIADLGYGKDATNAAPIAPGLLGYVLPGQTMRWTLEFPASRFDGGVFVARINGAADLQPLSTADTH